MSRAKDSSRRNIAAIARTLAPKAMEVLESLLNSEDEKVKLSAAEHVLDRAIGRPIAMTADVTDRLDEFTDEQLDAAIADVSARIAAAGAAESKEAPAVTTH